MNETVIVVTGAAPLDPDAVAHLPTGAIVLAADGGLDHALAAGLTPAGLVGDLDSVSAAGLAWAEAHATIERHSPAKDRTDTELALVMAASLAPARLIMIAGDGDRLDHTFAAIGALGEPSLTSIPTIEGWWGDQRFHVLHGPGRLRLTVPVGATVSLLATHGPCTGVSVTGTEWHLDDAELAPLSGHGVSNVATATDVEVTVSSGVLTIFTQPPATTKQGPA
jgi:thiamine pyrophosphokinase